MLSKFSERYRGRTYSVLVRKALGRKLSARATYARFYNFCKVVENRLFLVHDEHMLPVAKLQ